MYVNDVTKQFTSLDEFYLCKELFGILDSSSTKRDYIDNCIHFRSQYNVQPCGIWNATKRDVCDLIKVNGLGNVYLNKKFNPMTYHDMKRMAIDTYAMSGETFQTTDYIPRSINSLFLDNCNIEMLYKIKFNYLNEITIQDMKIKSFDFLPDDFDGTISLNNTGIESLSILPKGLRTLVITKEPNLTSLEGCPIFIENLLLNQCPNITLNGEPRFILGTFLVEKCDKLSEEEVKAYGDKSYIKSMFKKDTIQYV